MTRTKPACVPQQVHLHDQLSQTGARQEAEPPHLALPPTPGAFGARARSSAKASKGTALKAGARFSGFQISKEQRFSCWPLTLQPLPHSHCPALCCQRIFRKQHFTRSQVVALMGSPHPSAQAHGPSINRTHPSSAVCCRLAGHPLRSDGFALPRLWGYAVPSSQKSFPNFFSLLTFPGLARLAQISPLSDRPDVPFPYGCLSR